MFRKLIQKVNFKKTLRLLPFGFFVLLLIAIPHVAFAEEKSWWENLGAFFSLLYKFGANPIDGLLALLSQALLSIAGFIFFLVAGIFNATIQYTLIDLSQNLSGISAITIAWGVIRDLINMSFIFILLYIAIGTILDIGINWKNTLVKVVITAILINFSLFFTKIIIDASNLLALTFYNSFSNGTASSIASAFTNALKITSLYGNISTALDGSALQLMTAGLVGTIFLLVTCFVFLVATFLFLSRFVTIVFLLILSPIGFFGSILPGLGSAASKWRDTLIGQAIFAPIYMILTWITLQIVNDPGFKAPTGAKLSDAFSITASGLPPGGSTGGFMDLFMNYIIITIFMIATIIIAKQAANRGGGAIGQKLVGGAFGLGVTGAGFVGRNTIGRVGMRLARSNDLKEKADSGSVSARLALRASNYAAKSSFDVRGSKTAQNISKFGKSTGIGGLENFGLEGKGSGSGGAAKFREDRIKRLQKEYEERAKMYGANTESEKELLKNKRSEEESRLKAELEAIGRGENLSAADKAKMESIDAQIAQHRKEAEEQERLANDTSIPLADEQRADALEEAKKLKKQAEDREKEKSELIKEAQKSIREQLENVGVKDETKTFEDKKAREKYEKEIEQKKKDFESGQGRVKREAERIASGWGLFSAKEAKKKALDKIKKGGDKKPEDIFKEAVEKANEAAKESESAKTEAKEDESKGEKPAEGGK